jgi:hypothetical protein
VCIWCVYTHLIKYILPVNFLQATDFELRVKKAYLHLDAV